MMWPAVIAAFLVGAATGGWWSRRRAVSMAYQAGHATGEAAALAFATGGSVVFNGFGSDRELAPGAGAAGYDYSGHDLDRRAALERSLRRSADDVARFGTAGGGSVDGGAMGDSRPVVVERPDGRVI